MLVLRIFASILHGLLWVYGDRQTIDTTNAVRCVWRP